LGSIALQSESIDRPETSEHQITILELREKARAGNQEALAAVHMNARTTVIETFLKTGNIVKILANFNKHGHLQQHGHSYEAIHRNTLALARHNTPIAHYRSKTEALNWQRMEAAITAGELEDNWFVTFSLASDKESIAELRRQGYFVHTMTGVFQATTTKEGVVKTESAFVAGMPAVQEDLTISRSENNQRIAEAAKHRYDVDTVRKLYMAWGVAGAELMSTEDLLAMPLLIPKWRMPHGVATIVELYDQQIGGTFFGTSQPPQAYETFAVFCATRAATYDDVVNDVVQDWLAGSLLLRTPLDATDALCALVEKHTTLRACKDDATDARAIGARAIPIILLARDAWARGDMPAFSFFVNESIKNAEITFCGGGSGMDSDKGLEKSAQGDGQNGAGGNDLVNSSDSSNWKWRTGVCRVEACPTRPDKTKVGPCDVCRRCQHIFDKGIDPTKFKVRQSIVASIVARSQQPTKESLALAA
jgi:hypothetical protein